MGLSQKILKRLLLSMAMLGLLIPMLRAEQDVPAEKKMQRHFTPLSSIHSAPVYSAGSSAPGFAAPPSGLSAPPFGAALPPAAGGMVAGGLLQLARPVSVAVWNDSVFIADQGHQAILRYERLQDRFSIFYKMRVTEETRLTTTVSGSLYITDIINSQVLQVDNTGFSGSGVLVRQFRDFNLQKPVAVVEDSVRGRILVIDGMQNVIMAFNRLGRLQQVMHPVDLAGSPLTGLRDMVVGPDGLYLLDGVTHQVVITDFDGRFIAAFGRRALQQPAAIALDSEKRVIVADAFSSQLTVFVLGAKSAVQHSVSENTSVMQLMDIATADDVLYVADAGASRVLVMRVERSQPGKQ